MKIRLAMAAGAMGIAGTLAIVQPSPAQEAPQIGDILWPYNNAFCAFMREGHVFDYDDPDSWVFVFFAELAGDGLDRMNRSFMRLDGQLRELALDSVVPEGAGEHRTFHTFGDAPYTVELVTVPTDSGNEHTGFTGTITVSRGGMASSAAISGDCGV